MKQEAFQHFTDQGLTILALMIFVSFFIGLFFWVFRKSQTSQYRYMSQLPIEGEQRT